MDEQIPQVVNVLGISGDQQWLRPQSRQLIATADVIIGGREVLQRIAPLLHEHTICHDLTGQLGQVIEWIQQAWKNKQQVIVLASGDPLCFGIGKFLLRKLQPTQLHIIPDVSALQSACARFSISWEHARICSVHHRDSGEWNNARGRQHGLYPLFRHCMDADTIIAFTSPANSPARIARMLLDEGWGETFHLHVAAQLLQQQEHCFSCSATELAQQDVATPNILILQRRKPFISEPCFGLADHSFAQRKPEKGLITKHPVRAVSLAQLALHHDSIVWDIGAGSGAVGLEAARLCPDGWVYAIEKNEADVAIARQNQHNMGIHHYSLYHAKAPQELDAWPQPNAVFIGGSGGELEPLIRYIVERLSDGGSLVMNFVTIENFQQAINTLQTLQLQWTLTQLQASHSQPILHMQRLVADNPVWIIKAQKPVTIQQARHKTRQPTEHPI